MSTNIYCINSQIKTYESLLNELTKNYQSEKTKLPVPVEINNMIAKYTVLFNHDYSVDRFFKVSKILTRQSNCSLPIKNPEYAILLNKTINYDTLKKAASIGALALVKYLIEEKHIAANIFVLKPQLKVAILLL